MARDPLSQGGDGSGPVGRTEYVAPGDKPVDTRFVRLPDGGVVDAAVDFDPLMRFHQRMQHANLLQLVRHERLPAKPGGYAHHQYHIAQVQCRLHRRQGGRGVESHAGASSQSVDFLEYGPRIGHRFDVEPGMKIAQMVIAPFLSVNVEETAELSTTVRGQGGFGSTGV